MLTDQKTKLSGDNPKGSVLQGRPTHLSNCGKVFLLFWFYCFLAALIYQPYSISFGYVCASTLATRTSSPDVQTLQHGRHCLAVDLAQRHGCYYPGLVTGREKAPGVCPRLSLHSEIRNKTLPAIGLEPIHPRGRQILSLLRLPISPRRLVV